MSNIITRVGGTGTALLPLYLVTGFAGHQEVSCERSRTWNAAPAIVDPLPSGQPPVS